jgi:aryl-alcohol dehydrogenase-like predicted oxidoreductase
MGKLALGTVQFGLNYGISNQTGKVKVQEVKKILQLAKNSNIDTIDTAIVYGDSEKVIGDLGFKNFQIITKLPALHEDCEDIYSWVEKNVKLSLKRLKTPTLYGLLVHRTEDLLGNYGMKLIDALKIIKKNGLVKKIGISIYDPSECEKVMKLTRMDIVQAPLNIIDRRFESNGWLSRLHAEEVEIHTRSVFLQGLLLMPRNRIPNIFNEWSEVWDQWALKLKNNNLSALEACLSYPLSLPEIDKIIVGVENVNQLRDIIDKSKSKKIKNDFSFMISNNQMLINPSNW